MTMLHRGRVTITIETFRVLFPAQSNRVTQEKTLQVDCEWPYEPRVSSTRVLAQHLCGTDPAEEMTKFTVVDWLPVFIDETACRIVTDGLNYCIRK